MGKNEIICKELITRDLEINRYLFWRIKEENKRRLGAKREEKRAKWQGEKVEMAIRLLPYRNARRARCAEHEAENGVFRWF